MKPSLRYLSPEEIRRVHGAALALLGEVGMRLPCAPVLEQLAQAGARVEDGALVKIPAALVHEAIERAPKRDQVTLYGRVPERDVHLASRAPAFASMTMATHVIDPETDRRRPARLGDVGALTRLIDRLEHVAVNGAPVTPQDVPGEVCDWYTWAESIKNTTKHVTGGVPGARAVQDAVKMASAAVGGEEAFRRRPFLSGWVLTLPPLEIDHLSLEALIELGRWNLPAMVSSGPIMGASSPMSVAATLAQAHAEILGCLVASQLAHPGAPFVYTSFARIMDMRTANVSMASPEFGVLKGAMAQMGRFLGLPVRMPGLLRDAKALDAQAGFETGLTGTVAALAADLVDAMQLDMDLLVDYADLAFGNECMGALRRLARELVVDDDALALEVIREVGPGGAFIEHEHTFERFRQELWQPALFERRQWEPWERDGARTARERALEQVREWMGPQPASPLPPQAQAQIDRIVAQAEQDLVRGG
ncbi:MAG: glycine betaine--corrinoid protein methyltransferase [Deferrisomatales bacterium]